MRVSSRVRSCTGALGPRRPDSARRYAAGILSAAAVTSLAAAVLTNQASRSLQVSITVVLGTLAVALMALPGPRTRLLCVLAPLVGVGAIVVIDVATRDAGITGQIFFCLPVLYAATQLTAAGGILVTVAAIAGEAAVVLLLLPRVQAFTELSQVGTTLALTASLLIRASMVQDRLVAQLRRQAAIDPLTGLVTRRVLDEATQSAIGGADGQVGTALMMIDIDRFKAVNDTYGHVVGDDALSHVAGLLARSSRPQDVVARMGGDELAVLMPGCGYDVAVRRAEQFVALVRDTPLPLPGGGSVALSISAGASYAPQHGAGARALYASADAALYLAKHGGRGRVGRVSDGPQPDPPAGTTVDGADTLSGVLR